MVALDDHCIATVGNYNTFPNRFCHVLLAVLLDSITLLALGRWVAASIAA